MKLNVLDSHFATKPSQTLIVRFNFWGTQMDSECDSDTCTGFEWKMATAGLYILSFGCITNVSSLSNRLLHVYMYSISLTL